MLTRSDSAGNKVFPKPFHLCIGKPRNFRVFQHKLKKHKTKLDSLCNTQKSEVVVHIACFPWESLRSRRRHHQHEQDQTQRTSK